jgi:hypothetical protein
MKRRKWSAEPKGQSLADDLIGEDLLPEDARRFDANGDPLPEPAKSKNGKK